MAKCLPNSKEKMKLKLGTKEVAVDSISKVVGRGKHTATVHFIFGNAIIVRCSPTESIEGCTRTSTFHFDGTPTELRQRVERLKRKTWLRREREKENET